MVLRRLKKLVLGEPFKVGKPKAEKMRPDARKSLEFKVKIYESIATVGEIRVWWRADFQSGSRVLKKVF